MFPLPHRDDSDEIAKTSRTSKDEKHTARLRRKSIHVIRVQQADAMLDTPRQQQRKLLQRPTPPPATRSIASAHRTYSESKRYTKYKPESS
jgi:hypothetical protein